MSKSSRTRLKRQEPAAAAPVWSQLRSDLEGLTRLMSLQLQLLRAIRDSVESLDQARSEDS